MEGSIEALLGEQGELEFLVEQKLAVKAMEALRRQLPSGIVEEYFSSRRKAGEADIRGPVHFSVYCKELETEDAAPLLALKEVILSGTKMTLPGLRCVCKKNDARW